MGWGYDLRWPCIIERAGLRMGIVERFRSRIPCASRSAHYEHARADEARTNYLAHVPHLDFDDAFFICESYVEAIAYPHSDRPAIAVIITTYNPSVPPAWCAAQPCRADAAEVSVRGGDCRRGFG
jgi:hypothetical protein